MQVRLEGDSGAPEPDTSSLPEFADFVYCIMRISLERRMIE
jgi:hypothetical protein